jgi:TRAP-type C4-dicarboxylate transport system permease small subunit
MFSRFMDSLEKTFGYVLGGLFAGLIAVVFMQVIARNLLEIPLIWTLDLAQLLFSWCIFLGAALAFRKGQHYVVNLWPDTGPLAWIPVAASFAASLVVIYVLIRNGAAMTQISLNRMSPSLGITEFWFFIPIPIGGAFMALFLVEKILSGRKA